MSDIRERHNADLKGPTVRTDYDGTRLCWGCGRRWPCDAIREADRADKAEAALAGIGEGSRRHREVARARQRLRDQRDAARADAERLDEALGPAEAGSTAMATAPAACDGPS